MGVEILKIEMQAVKSRLEAVETHTNQLSEVVGDVIQAVRDNDKHYHDAFAIKSLETGAMTLRDQFAVVVLQGLCSKPETSRSIEHIANRVAAEAYAYADAMMAERRISMFEAAEEQKPTTAVSPQGVSVYEALRQLVGYVEDMSGHAEVARMTQPDTWAEQPDHPMALARAALKSGRGKSVHHAGDADGWITWHGGVCPIGTDVVVDVRFDEGSVWLDRIAGELSWSHFSGASNIVAYRVVRP